MADQVNKPAELDAAARSQGATGTGPDAPQWRHHGRGTGKGRKIEHAVISSGSLEIALARDVATREWVVYCYAVGICDGELLESEDLDAAKVEALLIVQERLKEMTDAFEAIKAATPAPVAPVEPAEGSVPHA